MRKAQRATWNAKSTRNRHNGRLNAAKRWVISAGQEFEMSDGKSYSTYVTKVELPVSPDDVLGTDENGIISRVKRYFIKTQTVRNPA